MTGLIPRPQRPRLAAAQRRFGAYLRERRHAKRIGLRALAAQVGLAAGHLSNIEHARVTPPEAPTIARMAEVLDVPVGALLARAGRLGPADLQRFWHSPLIPSLVMSSTGWTPEDVALFVEIVLASLPPMDPPAWRPLSKDVSLTVASVCESSSCHVTAASSVTSGVQGPADTAIARR